MNDQFSAWKSVPSFIRFAVWLVAIYIVAVPALAILAGAIVALASGSR